MRKSKSVRWEDESNPIKIDFPEELFQNIALEGWNAEASSILWGESTDILIVAVKVGYEDCVVRIDKNGRPKRNIDNDMVLLSKSVIPSLSIEANITTSIEVLPKPTKFNTSPEPKEEEVEYSANIQLVFKDDSVALKVSVANEVDTIVTDITGKEVYEEFLEDLRKEGWHPHIPAALGYVYHTDEGAEVGTLVFDVTGFDEDPSFSSRVTKILNQMENHLVEPLNDESKPESYIPVLNYINEGVFFMIEYERKLEELKTILGIED